VIAANEGRDLARAEAGILELMRAEAPFRPAALIERLAGRGVPERFVRLALWYLIDRDEVRFSLDRLLTLAPAPASPGGEAAVG
jgi:hypothetical protein